MRLVLWAVACAIGIAFATQAGFGWASAAVVTGVAAAGVVLARGRRAAVGGAAVALVAGAALGARARAVPPLDARLASAVVADRPAAVVGRVARGPEWAGRGARLQVESETVGGVTARGTLAVAVLSGWPDFGPGERVAFQARLHEVRGTRNPGLPDPALALRSAGIDVLAGVESPAAIARLAEPPRGGARRLAFLARRALRAAIDRDVGGESGGFLKTAVLGDRRGVGDDV